MFVHIPMHVYDHTRSANVIGVQDMLAVCVFWRLKLGSVRGDIYLSRRLHLNPFSHCYSTIWGGAGLTGDGKKTVVFPSETYPKQIHVY